MAQVRDLMDEGFKGTCAAAIHNLMDGEIEEVDLLFPSRTVDKTRK